MKLFVPAESFERKKIKQVSFFLIFANSVLQRGKHFCCLIQQIKNNPY